MNRKLVTVIVVALIYQITLALISSRSAQANWRPAGVSSIAAQAALSATFTYQGQLIDNGSPANGPYDFEFALFDASSGGAQLGIILVDDVTVVNGKFTVRLDFGINVFDGNRRWLQIGVRPGNGIGFFTQLVPRQEITPAPYSLYSSSTNSLQSYPITSTAPITGQVLKWTGAHWSPAIDEFMLPYARSISSVVAGFEITNTGTGWGGAFVIDNPINNRGALWVSTNGIGGAGFFNVFNPANSHAALNAGTNGTGNAISAYTSGSGDALNVSTDGSGWAMNAGNYGVGGGGIVIGIENAANPGNGLQVKQGGVGPGAHLHIYNPANNSAAVSADTNGGGNVIDAYTTGTGSAGVFRIDRITNTQPVLSAHTNGGGWAGHFTASGSGNGVYISVPISNAGLNVAGGTKNAVVETSQGARLLYTEEASQVWFTDYGFGKLNNGVVCIAIDPLFADTVNLDQPYHVFVQVYGNAEVYVSNRTSTSFEVHLHDGDPNVEFSYRLVATRRGYERTRLAPAPWAEGDPNVTP